VTPWGEGKLRPAVLGKRKKRELEQHRVTRPPGPMRGEVKVKWGKGIVQEDHLGGEEMLPGGWLRAINRKRLFVKTGDGNRLAERRGKPKQVIRAQKTKQSNTEKANRGTKSGK